MIERLDVVDLLFFRGTGRGAIFSPHSSSTAAAMDDASYVDMEEQYDDDEVILCQ